MSQDEPIPTSPAHRSQRDAPIHPKHLLHSKWTSAPQHHDYCHWEVIEHRKRAQEVVLRATLNKSAELIIPWRALRDRSLWTPGWV